MTVVFSDDEDISQRTFVILWSWGLTWVMAAIVGEKERERGKEREKQGEGGDVPVVCSADKYIAQRDVRDIVQLGIKLANVSVCWRREGVGSGGMNGVGGREGKTGNTPATFPSCLVLMKTSLRGTFVILWSWR